MRLSLCLVASTLASAQAFVSPRSVANGAPTIAFAKHINGQTDLEVVDRSEPTIGMLDATNSKKIIDGTSAAATTAALWASTVASASAAGPDWGIFEGRTLSLLHPAAMAGMLVFSLSTALLGVQWRRQRTLGDDISALKKMLPKTDAASLAEALAAAKEAGDSALVSKLQGGLETESQIKELQAERKELAAAGPRDKHFSQGALLAFVGTAFAIEGPLNTYARAGKLFPGPHLYAGAGLVVLWALAAACVPSMQKGSDAARTVHIGANVAGIGLFAWQVVSGVPILFKVIEFTKWP